MIEYPFDTLKVRMQTAQKAGTTSLANALARLRSFDLAYLAGLYRGLSLPLAGTILETATLFCANGYFKRKMYEMGQLPVGADLPMRFVLTAGAGTGFIISWVLTPIELIKCRMQVSGEVGTGGGTQRAYNGPMACLRSTIAEGGMAGLFRGHVATMFREVPGTALWFGAYEGFLRTIQPAGARREDIASIYVVAAGALGGVSYWGIMYPCDTVKSAIQTFATAPLQPTVTGTATKAASSAVPGTAAYFSTLSNAKVASAPATPPPCSVSTPGFFTVFRQLFRNYGLKGLYAGITPTLIRAMPSNAVIFLVYEQANRLFTRWAGLDME